ncbi:hypothetical protein [Candidatus Brocadia sapporoensis]|uniref:hypothetical protein n=1 Tax=Candidatus Brocadia sapporoensis TaxID=392547 RepID=UPI001E61CB39|nr:hypothetical protein [Candidatus Brocadia sapporoensis]
MFRESVLAFMGAGNDGKAKKKGKGCDARQKAVCKYEYGEFFEWACGNCTTRK